ncbi:hypothetical protein E4H12_02365 [Candidatus Thorarchaeota archaeon]|nr:MAG: hypothetical protein E4H12_02365 [Candidatus Thorarchaeota archaeon]
MSKNKKLSRLIPKNHFCSLGLFRDQPLIVWRYTKAVLFTAYDVYRSNDYWLDKTINSGKTLKEGLIDLGFPKTNTLVADTGVFEMEAKKAGIARNLGIDVDIELTNEQIFEAYSLSGADYFVAPDEIVLPEDDQTVVLTKIEKIKDNLLELLEVVPASKVIAVIQGHEEDTITDLYDFYREHEISCFAIGGLIPLYHHSKEKLEKVLTFVRNLTQDYWLHIFGLPRMSLLQYYLHKIGVDSVDTSALLYLTARRRYLVGSKGEQVRTVDFKKCSCKGCSNLDPIPSPRSPEFFVNLYIHNILAAVRLAVASSFNLDLIGEKESNNGRQEKRAIRRKMDSTSEEMIRSDSIQSIWMTAEESLALSKKKKEQEPAKDSHYNLSELLHPNKINPKSEDDH